MSFRLLERSILFTEFRGYTTKHYTVARTGWPLDVAPAKPQSLFRGAHRPATVGGMARMAMAFAVYLLGQLETKESRVQATGRSSEEVQLVPLASTNQSLSR